MIFVTGDCHAEWSRFLTKNFPIQKELTREDFVIVCGDFGLWDDSLREKIELDALAKRNFTLLFVDGNHENFDRLYGGEFPVVKFHGGKAHKIRDNIYHLMRGEVFELDGKKFFTFGGASSHDIQDGVLQIPDYPSRESCFKAYENMTKHGKMVRINHVSWWKQEMPSRGEMDHGLKTLEDHAFCVDYILTHCAPNKVLTDFFEFREGGDHLTAFLEDVRRKTEFKHWYFGHYHVDYPIGEQFTAMYRGIERIV